MKDAAIVPIMSQNFPQIASSRVRGVLPNGSDLPDGDLLAEHR